MDERFGRDYGQVGFVGEKSADGTRIHRRDINGVIGQKVDLFDTPVSV